MIPYSSFPAPILHHFTNILQSCKLYIAIRGLLAPSVLIADVSKVKRKAFATIMKSFCYKYFLPCPGNTSPQYVQRNGSGIVGHLPSSSIRYFVESSQSSSASVQRCNFYAEVFPLPFDSNTKLQYVPTSE